MDNKTTVLSHTTLLRSFSSKYEASEITRRNFLLTLFNAVAILALSGFTIAAIRSGRTALAIALTLTLMMAFIGIITLYISKTTRASTVVAIFGACGLYLFLITTGGVENTGMLWCYPIVAVIVVLAGFKHGLYLICLTFSITGAIFLLPSIPSYFAVYTTEVKIRFFASNVALAIFVTLTEYARARNQLELLKLSAQLDELSYTDLLTGLPNRRFIMECMSAENSRRSRYKRPYTIIFGDVDNFKSINDNFGHEAGDQVLKVIAAKLRSILRSEDIPGRWGGEEFLIVVPEADEQKGLETAERIRIAIANTPISYRNNDISITMSFGVETVLTEGGIEEFINSADRKLYAAKRNGKNQCVNTL
jgi:diguanylate cyclase (GGDEF)-like protein